MSGCVSSKLVLQYIGVHFTGLGLRVLGGSRSLGARPPLSLQPHNTAHVDTYAQPMSTAKGGGERGDAPIGIDEEKRKERLAEMKAEAAKRLAERKNIEKERRADQEHRWIPRTE